MNHHCHPTRASHGPTTACSGLAFGLGQPLKPNVKPEREDKIMKKTAFYFLSVMLLITPVAASSSDSIPNAKLRVTVQQREDGKINKGFHVLELSCWDGTCSLSSVSLTELLHFLGP
jgi:hypothetical protein